MMLSTDDEYRLRIYPLKSTGIDVRMSIAVANALTQANIQWRVESTSTAPSGKGDVVVSAILLKALDHTLGKIIDTIMGLFMRPGAPPVEIELETRDGKARVKFDPRRLKPEQVPDLVAALAGGIRSS